MSRPVAIITGAASGIGLALTSHLLRKQWRVVMADINASKGQILATGFGPNAIFIETDVSSWESQVKLFERAYEWSGNRFDFLASNAGIADERNLAEGLQEIDGMLQKPDLKPLEVNLLGSIYGTQLFTYYFRKSRRTGGGMVVITSSLAGQYGMSTHPVYCASKHAVIGLARSIGPTFKDLHGVAVNCILPSFVVTGITIPALVAIIPKQHITPMDTMMKGFDTFLDDTEGKTGQVLEVSINEMYFRNPVDFVDESQRWFMEESSEYFATAFGQSTGRMN